MAADASNGRKPRTRRDGGAARPRRRRAAARAQGGTRPRRRRAARTRPRRLARARACSLPAPNRSPNRRPKSRCSRATRRSRRARRRASPRPRRTAPTVQWELSTDGGKTFAPIEGATSTTYTIPSTVVSENGRQFRASFTNGGGESHEQSRHADRHRPAGHDAAAGRRLRPGRQRSDVRIESLGLARADGPVAAVHRTAAKPTKTSAARPRRRSKWWAPKRSTTRNTAPSSKTAPAKSRAKPRRCTRGSAAHRHPAAEHDRDRRGNGEIQLDRARQPGTHGAVGSLDKRRLDVHPDRRSDHRRRSRSRRRPNRTATSTAPCGKTPPARRPRTSPRSRCRASRKSPNSPKTKSCSPGAA